MSDTNGSRRSAGHFTGEAVPADSLVPRERGNRRGGGVSVFPGGAGVSPANTPILPSVSDPDQGRPSMTDHQPHIEIRPAELKDANAFIAANHRHHKPVQGHRFSLSAYAGDQLVGVATVGRPVARNGGAPSEVLEVTRLCTDGTPNVCSALYAAAARVGRELGYRRIQTYILDTEPGTSLRAAGWVNEGEAGGGQWKHTDGKPRRTDQPIERKQRWARALQ